MVVQTIKQGLHKFGIQKGHLGGLGLATPMNGHVVYIALQASLASFPPYFLLFGHELGLPTSI
jgi:hypothetical protein